MGQRAYRTRGRALRPIHALARKRATGGPETPPRRGSRLGSTVGWSDALSHSPTRRRRDELRAPAAPIDGEGRRARGRGVTGAGFAGAITRRPARAAADGRQQGGRPADA